MKRWQLYIPALTVEIAILLCLAVFWELRSSDLQSWFFSTVASQVTFTTEDGPSPAIRFPTTGPFDLRLGYTRIPEVTDALLKNGYTIEQQARMSPRLQQLVDLGVFPTYREKNRAGLRVLDRTGTVLYQVQRPERSFESFKAIPDIIVQTLLFIENREILDNRYPHKNPAVEWDRLGKAVLEKAVQEVYPDHSAPGGSTLATQLEKYRHGYEGRTRTAKDKLQQMLSASFRAYLDGPITLDRRYRIILDYINSIPLAALPGYGEVNGLGDGLWAWYDADVRRVSELLEDPKAVSSPELRKELAQSYKQVLSLFISHRRPSGFLLGSVDVLNKITDDYLGLLANHGIISPELRDACMEVELRLRSTAPPPPPMSFLDRKAANAIRTQLLTYLGMSKLYDLDQVDVSIESAIDKGIQDAVTESLRSLKSKKVATEMGLTGERTLDRGNLEKVVYSVTLYEHLDGANLLRVQTDNWDRPFNINEGTKLDLGSTAKLRTLTNYLYIVSQLHEKWAAKSATENRKIRADVTDPISEWALDYLSGATDRSLAAMIDAAMSRHYSANPGEAFFTGGGLHRFVNFKKEDNGKVPDLSESLRFSINLPFIRLMRDLVRYYMAQIPGSPTRGDDEANLQARKEYLARFADKEGSYFIEQFFQKYRKVEAPERFPELVRSIRATPVRLAALYRYVHPEKPLADFSAFLSQSLPFSSMSTDTVGSLYEKYGPGKFSLQDQGYVARIHPLELWLVRYLERNPTSKLSNAIAASKNERQEVYEWLFKTKHRHAQDKRIKVLIETQAFVEMHKVWQRFGYPFESLVPSYATAIGTSGDRPAALAELVGIILNDGVRYPNVRIEELHFAAGTPFDTSFRQHGSSGNRVMPAEIAARLRTALADVVENGTARRVSKAFTTTAGKEIRVGGKTGTGDHRYETFGAGGQLLSSRVVNRTATFAFYIGKSFFGVVTAHVHGPDAAQYDFTSALAAGLLKALAPALLPLIREAEEGLRLQAGGACPVWGSIPPLTEQFIRESEELPPVRPLASVLPKPKGEAAKSLVPAAAKADAKTSPAKKDQKVDDKKASGKDAESAKPPSAKAPAAKSDSAKPATTKADGPQADSTKAPPPKAVAEGSDSEQAGAKSVSESSAPGAKSKATSADPTAKKAADAKVAEPKSLKKGADGSVKETKPDGKKATEQKSAPAQKNSDSKKTVSESAKPQKKLVPGGDSAMPKATPAATKTSSSREELAAPAVKAPAEPTPEVTPEVTPVPRSPFLSQGAAGGESEVKAAQSPTSSRESVTPTPQSTPQSTPVSTPAPTQAPNVEPSSGYGG